MVSEFASQIDQAKQLNNFFIFKSLFLLPIRFEKMLYVEGFARYFEEIPKGLQPERDSDIAGRLKTAAGFANVFGLFDIS